MSRSYKKHPTAGDKNDGFNKKYFNRKLRRKLKNDFDYELPNNSFKKANQSWDIKDYSFSMTWEEYCDWAMESWKHGLAAGYESEKTMPNKEECYKEWKRHYQRK